eukprot:gene51693-4229_t
MARSLFVAVAVLRPPAAGAAGWCYLKGSKDGEVAASSI